jgi:hypothetical protein
MQLPHPTANIITREYRRRHEQRGGSKTGSECEIEIAVGLTFPRMLATPIGLVRDISSPGSYLETCSSASVSAGRTVQTRWTMGLAECCEKGESIRPCDSSAAFITSMHTPHSQVGDQKHSDSLPTHKSERGRDGRQGRGTGKDNLHTPLVRVGVWELVRRCATGMAESSLHVHQRNRARTADG